MRERTLGATDLRVSALGLGCNNFGIRTDLEQAREIVAAALDVGITFFDTADVYGQRGGSEAILGEVLGPRRKDVVLVSKFGVAMDDEGKLKGGSARYVTSAIEASLRRLKTDWIDIYYYHRPDPATPLAETLHALEKLIAQGKVRHIGCSNMTGVQITEARRIANDNGLHHFIVAQEQYNLLSRQIEGGVLPTIETERMSLIPYFPLASGLLTGKYKPDAPLPPGSRMTHKRYSDRFYNEENLHIVDRLRAFCAARNRSLVELALGWLLSKSAVGCVIAGASAPEQVRQNAMALGWALSANEMAEVEQLTMKQKAA